jgi:hypothetical protein
MTRDQITLPNLYLHFFLSPMAETSQESGVQQHYDSLYPIFPYELFLMGTTYYILVWPTSEPCSYDSLIRTH